jgi:hypothetical protein
MRRTWGPRGRTLVICHRFKWKRASMAAGLCYGSRGGGAQLAFHHQLGAYDTDTLIGALEGLRRQRSWLVVEPLPAYTPELNPVQPLWASLKGGGAGQPGRRAPQGGHCGGRGWQPADPPHPPAGLLVPAALRACPLW